ncbi:MAG: acyl-CoA/acyl-ACP dehydrogenase [Burkholderiaceae bacterium]|nr:acyl-CoA/acyl-ACP dehydrogenase [Burkholderiaceae bacterium]
MALALNQSSSLCDDPTLIPLDGRRDTGVLRVALSAVLHVYPSLPLPGRGRTLERWRALQAVAAIDLVLVKLAEPHWDAQAILADCFDGAEPAAIVALNALAESSRDASVHAGNARNDNAGDGATHARLWAVWASEPPDARVTGYHGRDSLHLTGRKAWCSGASLASHALVTYWDGQGRACLAAVALDAPGVSIGDTGWHAVGMDATASTDVHFDETPAIMVGEPGQYLARPGFWHGGMGIAACWLGACVTLAQRVASTQVGSADSPAPKRADPHAQAHLGAIDVAVSQAQALMRETANWVDAHPQDDAAVAATRIRSVAEHCATDVLWHAARALGAAPMCREAATARLFADLPVFIRQSHAERDLASLAASLNLSETSPWTL